MPKNKVMAACFIAFLMGGACELLIVASGVVRLGPKVERVVVLPPMTEIGYTVHFTLKPYDPPIGKYQGGK